MPKINEYIDGDFKVEEFSNDGVTVTSTMRTYIATESIPQPEPTPSIEQEILYETKYQTMLLEMGGI